MLKINGVSLFFKYPISPMKVLGPHVATQMKHYSLSTLRSIVGQFSQMVHFLICVILRLISLELLMKEKWREI